MATPKLATAQHRQSDHLAAKMCADCQFDNCSDLSSQNHSVSVNGSSLLKLFMIVDFDFIAITDRRKSTLSATIIRSTIQYEAV